MAIANKHLFDKSKTSITNGTITMSTAKTSIIFVAGAWHTEFHVQPILPYLEADGYRVVPVKLRTSGRHDPLPTIQDNIEHIRDVLKAEINAGYRVCLLGHSVSGQSVAAAGSEFLATATSEEKARLVHIIFIACFLNAIRATEGAQWYTIDYTTLWATVNHAYESFYNDMAPEDAQPYVAALDCNRGQMPPENIPDLWKTQVKGTYFLCRKDKAIPPHFQALEAEENGMRLVELDMDHCPFVSKPRELAEELHRALQAE
jgi:pimeloyl-ACP methyl ester carboxylesterase